jgi:dihydrofolate reductase
VQLIAAVSKTGGLGRGGRLLFSIPDDLARFKQLTWGGTVVMGRKTLDSLPGGRPLPGRVNVVLSRTGKVSTQDVTVCRNVTELESLLPTLPEPISVIGGGEIYRLLLDRCDVLHLTEVEEDPEADVWLPMPDETNWNLTWESPMQEAQGRSYRYCTYERRGEP